MRKLASIRRITELSPIEGADAIEAATVDGWKVVVKKGEYKVGDLAIYLEIDSWVPETLAPFLIKGGVARVYNGVPGAKLKTIRLRGQISQGLLLPYQGQGQEGDDVTEQLGVQKWEPPEDGSLGGLTKSTFPTHLLPKTDQERVQNCMREIRHVHGFFDGETFEKTMKLDGSSMTIYRINGELNVASRNQLLKLEGNDTNAFIMMANKIADKIPEGYAFQGELMGPKIQGNKEGFAEYRFFVFDAYIYDADVVQFIPLLPNERRSLVEALGLEHVPVMNPQAVIGHDVTVNDFLLDAEGPSIHASQREGIVWKSNSRRFSFKAISNKWLLKHDG